MILFGTSLILALWLGLFAVQLVTASNLKTWLVLDVLACMGFSGTAIGFGGTAKDLIFGNLFLIGWAYGLVILPVPEGYAEAVYGGWAVLAMIVVIAYFEYEKRRGKTACTRSIYWQETTTRRVEEHTQFC